MISAGGPYLPYWVKRVHFWIRIHTLDTYCMGGCKQQEPPRENSVLILFLLNLLSLFYYPCE